MAGSGTVDPGTGTMPPGPACFHRALGAAGPSVDLPPSASSREVGPAQPLRPGPRAGPAIRRRVRCSGNPNRRGEVEPLGSLSRHRPHRLFRSCGRAFRRVEFLFRRRVDARGQTAALRDYLGALPATRRVVPVTQTHAE